MTSRNGATPEVALLDTEVVLSEPQEVGPTEQEPGEPVFSKTSLDYWVEMTQRQVERLGQEIAALEAQVGPLRQQQQALQVALNAVSPRRRGSLPGSRHVLVVTDADKAEIARMEAEGKTTKEVADAMPHLKRELVYSHIYAARQRRLKGEKAAQA